MCYNLSEKHGIFAKEFAASRAVGVDDIGKITSNKSNSLM